VPNFLRGTIVDRVAKMSACHVVLGLDLRGDSLPTKVADGKLNQRVDETDTQSRLLKTIFEAQPLFLRLKIISTR
jgi:hypothetical protein